jgi:hypothetical protein
MYIIYIFTYLQTSIQIHSVYIINIVQSSILLGFINFTIEEGLLNI